MACSLRRSARSRSAWLALLASLAALTACTGTEQTPATQVIVAITSDLPAEETLSRVEVTLSRRDGSDVTRMQDFAIVAGEAQDGEYVLPLSFSVVPGEESSFLIAVTGYGPLGAGGAEEKLVEQRAIATFEPETTLLLRIFLGRICLRNFCDGDATQVCYAADKLDVQAGQCGELLAFEPEDLETVDLELLPDLSLPPDGVVVLGTDGGADDDGPDAGGGAGSAGSAGDGSLDGGVDAGCVGDDCPCTDDDSCDDELYCTIDACEGDGECSHEPRVCKRDDSACTRPPQCDERENACVEAFDSASLTSLEHCGSSATASCETCEEIDEFEVSCVAGRCRRECSDDGVGDRTFRLRLRAGIDGFQHQASSSPLSLARPLLRSRATTKPTTRTATVPTGWSVTARCTTRPRARATATAARRRTPPRSKRRSRARRTARGSSSCWPAAST